MTKEETNAWVAGVMGQVPRGSFEQNKFRGILSGALTRELGPNRSAATVGETIDWAAKDIAPDFDPQYDASLRDLVWPNR